MMGNKKRKSKEIVNKPPSLTIQQMVDDVEGADDDDYVFKFIQALDEEVVHSSGTGATLAPSVGAGDDEDDDDDDSDDEFYDVRDNFDTDSAFVYETIEQRYERMCEFVRKRRSVSSKRGEMLASCRHLASAAARMGEQVEELRNKVKQHIHVNPTPPLPNIPDSSSSLDGEQQS